MASVKQRFNLSRVGHTDAVQDEKKKRKKKKVPARGDNDGEGRSGRSRCRLSLNPSADRKERKMIILNERYFSVDLQGLSKPKPSFPLGEGRVRYWHGAHRIIW